MSAALGLLFGVVTVVFHEGVHATVCLAQGFELQELRSNFVLCHAAGGNEAWVNKLRAASASLANLVVGLGLFHALGRGWLTRASSSLRWATWLLALMQLSAGFGYFLFSAVSGFGDWQVVIDGWQPRWAWRLGMFLLGAGGWFAGIAKLMPQLVHFDRPGAAAQRTKHLLRLLWPAYIGSLAVPLIAAASATDSWSSPAFFAALASALGGNSPLLWIAFWYVGTRQEGPQTQAASLRPSVPWLAATCLVAVAYGSVLGPGLKF